MKQLVEILSIEPITHDVLRIRTEKPNGLTFVPGQATEIFLTKDGWEDEGRPFTFTSLPKDDYLEFTIKTYPDHKGVTNEFLHLKNKDELIVNDVFGAIQYKGEGTFVAGGAGVTPFISILRDLKSKNKLGNNKLIFANRTKADIILNEEMQQMLGANFINILSQEHLEPYAFGNITADFICENSALENYFYLCGPPPMMAAVERQLLALHVPKQKLITEDF